MIFLSLYDIILVGNLLKGNKHMSKRTQANLLLFMTAFIWGFAFVAQRSGMDYIGPFLFSGIRMVLGAAALFFIAFFSDKKGTWKDPGLIKSGLLLGVVMFFAGNLQQVGLVFTTAGKTGFITALYIMIVPVLGIFLKHKIGKNVWIGVALSTVGVYLLCITESFTIEMGDFIVFIGAFFWAFQILILDRVAIKYSVVRLISIQFFVSGIMSFITAIFADSYFSDPLTWDGFMKVLPAILYVGLLSTAGAATFQGLGQRYAKPATASIILGTESVFGVLCGYVFLGEVLSTREIVGCVLMFAAIIIVQLNSSDSMKESEIS